MPSVRVTRRQRTIGVVSSAAFHIVILVGLAFELDKPIDIVEQPPIQVTLTPPIEEPPPIPVPIPVIPPKPQPAPVKTVQPPQPTPATPAKPLQAPEQPAAPAKQATVQPAAAAAPTPIATPAPKPAPVVRVKAPTPVAHAAPTAAPTPIAHTAQTLIQSPLAPVMLPPAPQVAGTSPPPSASAAAAASAAPGAAAGPNGLRDALRLGFGCAHPDAVNLTPAERETCRKNGLAHAGPGFAIQPPEYILREGRANEARRAYQTSNSQHDYPGLRCIAGRDCEPDPPTPSPDPVADTCPYMRCNMGNVR